ncbi:gluconate 5-dehydrogenase [Betaproteobacteria bacterium]|nr:gluconate 5-dehydrogenase [Betaproteobacteria bacterium]
MSGMFDLSGKTALVTGAGRGLGFAFARGIAMGGARVIINDLTAEVADTAAETLRKEGLDASAAAFNVIDAAAAEDAVARIEKDVSPLDILFNNAGIHRRASLVDMPEESWRAVIDTNLTSAFIVGRTIARRMIPRGAGKIINTCSINCERPRPEIANYSAAKGGLVLLTRAMCVEWAKYNIQVNGIAPGYMLTEMTLPLSQDPERNAWIESITPAKRWGKPEDLIGAAIFLSSGASNFVNGHVLFVDGGMRYAL